MKSCQEHLSELREKINVAEDQLRVEKKNLFKKDEFLTEEKEKWAKEIKAEQLKIHANEKEIKKREARLEELKNQCNETLKKCTDLESENEKMRKELQRVKHNQQEEINKYHIMIENLEKELSKVEDKQKELKLANKWTRFFQDKELKSFEVENENQLKEEVKQLSQDFAKKIEAFDENLKDIETVSIKTRHMKLKELKETLAQLKYECGELENKNVELEREIKNLESLSKA